MQRGGVGNDDCRCVGRPSLGHFSSRPRLHHNTTRRR